MLKELRARLIGIVRNEDGAALVVTLAVFFFMYLLIAGVYAVGTSVKNRIHLQNACDAAAYSAAVVQADTLSRIATINRAMSWTYVQMTRRQMDYIVKRWLDETVTHYDYDRREAKAFSEAADASCLAHRQPPNGWHISDIELNGHSESQVSRDQIVKSKDTEFPRNLSDYSASFYSQSASLSELPKQIKDDKTTIRKMNEAVKSLATEMVGKIETAVEDVLRANVPETEQSRCRYYLKQHANPLQGYRSVTAAEDDGYLVGLKNLSTDEDRFLSFAGYEDVETTFEAGIDDWFVYGDGSGSTRQAPGDTEAKGFQRSYRHWSTGKLYSKWVWHATQWCCGEIEGFEYHFPVSWKTACDHVHDTDKCYCRLSNESEWFSDTFSIDEAIWSGGLNPSVIGLKSASIIWRRDMTATCYADNNEIWDKDLYVGETAYPLVLRDSYFGKAGTITVGLAMKNENPWLSLLGAGGVAQGIYSAFNPFHECQWSWAFASAKAGYKQLGDEWKPETIDGAEVMSRNYYIDWKPGSWSSSAQSWNLCQSDWDAVLVPVRCAESQATSGAWVVSDDTTGHLAEYVVGDWKDLGAVGVVDSKWSQMKAGGTKEPADADQYAQRFDELHAVTTDFDGSGEVKAEWQIGNRNAQLDWEQLANWMRH